MPDDMGKAPRQSQDVPIRDEVAKSDRLEFFQAFTPDSRSLLSLVISPALKGVESPELHELWQAAARQSSVALEPPSHPNSCLRVYRVSRARVGGLSNPWLQEAARIHDTARWTCQGQASWHTC